MVVSCCRDISRFTDIADWILGVTARSSIIEVPHSVFVLIDGCAVWVAGMDDLVSAMSLDYLCANE